MSTVDVEIAIQRKGRRKPLPEPTAPRIPRVARLMALAIKFQGMIDRREVHDYADLARLGYVTRARLTQVMNLLLLAPDLQEQLLFSSGTTAIQERRLRSVVKLADWHDQRKSMSLH